MKRKYIVFDIGKTKILAAVLKVGRNSNGFLELNEYKNTKNPKRIREILLEFSDFANKKYWTKKIAISAAHLIDSERKMARQGKKCYGTDFFDFRFLEKAGYLVKIENDGRCFVLGEYHFGKGRNAKNILAINLGTEIGGGFICNGKSYRGSHSSALEISHISATYAGLWKDWAGLCAGKGIENLYEKETGEKLGAQEIFQGVTKNNEMAKEVVAKAATALGMGTASLMNILDPETIIFGGSLSKQKKYIAQAIEIARKNVFNKKANYKFAISTLGNKANLLGAAMLYKN